MSCSLVSIMENINWWEHFYKPGLYTLGYILILIFIMNLPSMIISNIVRYISFISGSSKKEARRKGEIAGNLFDILSNFGDGKYK